MIPGIFLLHVGQNIDCPGGDHAVDFIAIRLVVLRGDEFGDFTRVAVTIAAGRQDVMGIVIGDARREGDLMEIV